MPSTNPSNGPSLVRQLVKSVTASYTRPNDTTQYASGDVVANSTSAATILTFSNMAVAPGKGGVIQGVTLIDSVNATIKPDFELYLFNATITMQNDNVQWAITDSDLQKLVSEVDLPGAYFRVANVGTGATGNGTIVRDSLSIAYNCTTTDTSLYGVLIIRNSYTPVGLETFDIQLRFLQDQ